MNGPLEMLYFDWLCAKVVVNKNSSPTNNYWRLLRILQNTEFVWLLSGDDNRAADGLDLRREFIIAADLPDDPEWRKFPECSVLEMLVAFCRRAEFMTDIKSTDWFWEFLDNLGLKEFNDASTVEDEVIYDILETFIWRTFEFNGKGGMFPLDSPKHDQKDVEIWYQFCEYLVDQDRLP